MIDLIYCPTRWSGSVTNGVTSRSTRAVGKIKRIPTMKEAIEFNRQDAIASAGAEYAEEKITVPA
jgi:hypothetical protein